MKKMQCILMVLVLMVALCAAASAGSPNLLPTSSIQYNLGTPVLPQAQSALVALLFTSAPMIPFRDIFRPPISPHRRTRKPLPEAFSRVRLPYRRSMTLCCVK